MNTAVTQCPRCGGQAGAHFGFCFVAQLWERLMGPDYPWAPPAPAEDEIPLPPEPDEGEWDWADNFEAEYGDLDTHGFVDPPDPQGVYEDFLVGSGLVESDANWMPHQSSPNYGEGARPADSAAGPGLKSIEVAKTDLPEGYYDQLVIPEPKPQRKYNVGPMRAAHDAMLRAQEDAAVLFVYDCCDLEVPGGRVPLSELYERFVEWQQANDMPSMSKDRLRALLEEIGVVVEPGRLPGMRKSGKAPLLVHGLVLKQPQTVVVTAHEKVPVTVAPKVRHSLLGAKPGGEIPKWARSLIEPLITEQGWEYQPSNGNGRGKPRVKSPTGKVCTLPSTAHSSGHTIENTRSFLKANGAVL